MSEVNPAGSTVFSHSRQSHNGWRFPMEIFHFHCTWTQDLTPARVARALILFAALRVWTAQCYVHLAITGEGIFSTLSCLLSDLIIMWPTNLFWPSYFPCWLAGRPVPRGVNSPCSGTVLKPTVTVHTEQRIPTVLLFIITPFSYIHPEVTMSGWQ